MKRGTLGTCALCLVAFTTQARGDRTPQLGTLTAMADRYGTDKGTQGHNYTRAYELYFSPIRQKARKVFEIGVWKGASLRMWRDYFPNAKIYGIDIADTSSVNSQRISTFVADQANRKQLKAFIDKAGGDFDIILDDGGHRMEQQQISFGYLFSYVKPGGYYVIEDVHTSIYAIFRDGYGATPTGERTTLAMIDNFVRTGNVESPYMTPEEKKYLTSNVASADLMSQNKGHSVACIFKKRDPSEDGRKRKPQ